MIQLDEYSVCEKIEVLFPLLCGLLRSLLYSQRGAGANHSHDRLLPPVDDITPLLL